MCIGPLFLLLQTFSAYTLTGRIEFEKLPRPIQAQSIQKSTLLLYKLGEKSEFIQSISIDKTGAFSFTPAPGSLYLLKVRTPAATFSEVLVDSRTSEQPVLSLYNPLNVPESRVLTEARLTPTKILVFEPPKEAFDALQFLKNPMVLFAGGMILLMTMLGRLQENMGDEADVRTAESKALVDQTMKLFRSQ
jgi:hypothetical protein